MFQLHAIHKQFNLDSKIQSKRIKKINHINNNQKRVGMAMLISEKIDFNVKIVLKTKNIYSDFI